MAIAVKKGTIKTTTYDVNGANLADIWADIQKNGPKYKGATRAGKTTCKLVMDAATSKFEFTTKEDKKVFEAEAKMSAGELAYDCTIEMPKLKDDKGLSDAAKKEWARFMKELEAHENEHVADFGKTSAKIGKEIEALKTKGKGDSKVKAEKAAHAEYVKEYTKTFSGAENDKRLNAGADALDSGGHGPTLKTSIK